MPGWCDFRVSTTVELCTLTNPLCLLLCVDATDEEMYEAAQKANIHDVILSLPEGYQTNVGAKVCGASLVNIPRLRTASDGHQIPTQQ